MSIPTPEERKKRIESIKAARYDTDGDVAALIDELSRREQEHQEEIDKVTVGRLEVGSMLDFPLAFAIQRVFKGELQHHPKCSQPGMLCDCGAVEAKYHELYDVRHSEEIRKAKEEGWDSCAGYMAGAFPGWPEAADKMRKENFFRAPSTPPNKEALCETCGEEETALGGDAHCTPDCDDVECHPFVAPPQEAA